MDERTKKMKKKFWTSRVNIPVILIKD